MGAVICSTFSKPKSNVGFNVGGRYWYSFTDDVDFIPHLAFVYNSMGFTIPAPATEDSTSKTIAFDLGWGVNVRPAERVLLLFDLGLQYARMDNKDVQPEPTGTNEAKITVMNLPYYKVGLEGHVTKWWDVRLGAVKVWEGVKNDMTTANATEKFGTTSTSTYLGSGFHFGNLTIDAWLDPDFVLSGPNFLSGRSEDLAIQASILYTWK